MICLLIYQWPFWLSKLMTADNIGFGWNRPYYPKAYVVLCSISLSNSNRLIMLHYWYVKADVNILLGLVCLPIVSIDKVLRSNILIQRPFLILKITFLLQVRNQEEPFYHPFNTLSMKSNQWYNINRHHGIMMQCLVMPSFKTIPK